MECGACDAALAAVDMRSETEKASRRSMTVYDPQPVPTVIKRWAAISLVLSVALLAGAAISRSALGTGAENLGSVLAKVVIGSFAAVLGLTSFWRFWWLVSWRSQIAQQKTARAARYYLWTAAAFGAATIVNVIALVWIDVL